LTVANSPAFAALRSEYAQLWDTMTVSPGRIQTADNIATRLRSNRGRYEVVERATGVPWFVIAVIHNLESGGNFARHLHNGDPLTARTTHVPAGRPLAGAPPFTWEESAIDALRMKDFDKNHDWSAEKIAYLLEGYNGWGYRLYHASVLSPYLWSFSSHYTAGKYIADGKWSATAVSEQCGAMVLLKRLEHAGVITLGAPVPKPPDVEPPAPRAPPADTATGAVEASLATVAAGIMWAVFGWIGIATVAAAIVAVLVIRARRKARSAKGC